MKMEIVVVFIYTRVIINFNLVQEWMDYSFVINMKENGKMMKSKEK